MENFENIYLSYINDIFYFILKLCSYNYTIAEELTQETFYQAFLSFSSFKGECHIKTWLCQIAKNVWYGYCKKHYKENYREDNSIDEYTYDNINDKIEQRDLLKNIWFIVDTFDDRTKKVMFNHIFLNLTYRKIGQLLNISESSAKVIYFRGKNRLLRILKEDYKYDM